MSARKRTAKAIKQASSSSGAKDEELSTPQAMILRPPRRKLRGRRGSLELLPTVALDVILEILRQLHPRDLLSLSQTSREFRAFLLTRANAFVWRTARKALPGALTDPHPVLSEPELANLMFSFHCNECGRGPVHKVIWLWFKRYCSTCLIRMTCPKGEVERRLQDTGLLTLVERGDFSPILSVIHPRQYGSSWNKEYNRCHVPQVTRLEQQCRDLRAAGGADTPGLRALYEAQKTHIQAAAELSDKLELWARDERLRRCDEETQMREERFKDILGRLREAGWGLELDYRGRDIRWDMDGPARELRYKGKPVAKLTDRAWPKVYKSIKDYMMTIRQERTAPKTLLRTVDRAIAASDATYSPTATDLAWMPESETLFTNFSGDVSAVASLVALWQARFREQLCNQIAAICPDIPSGIDPFDLAVAVFGCKSCESRPKPAAVPPALRYPQIIDHECFRQHDRWAPDAWPLPLTQEYHQGIHDYELETTRRCPIVVERISMTAARRGCTILATLRRDPNKTTAADMDELGCKLMCMACAPEERLFMFDWSSGVSATSE
ncbi:hypothetical protein C2E23DRAFT_860212 [Lenzites betulinus]|nr:hypothetical protein C2E23DRAFT_860212 [Lenzites betulinus]